MRRNVTSVTKRLASENVAYVHLNQRSGEHRTGVADAHGGVRQRAGVEQHRCLRIGGFVQPADQLALVVGLPDLDVQAEFGTAAHAERGEFCVAR